jgi:hypothetical protein
MGALGLGRSRPRVSPIRAVLAALILVMVAPGVVSAAPPSNDLPAGAEAITAIPATLDQDTTEATVAPEDDLGCGAGGVDQATVWYTLTLPEAATVIVDAGESGYDVGVNAFESDGSAPGALFNCSFAGVVIDAAANTTYFLMFADIDGDTVNGGALHVEVGLAPPPLEVSLTVNSFGRVSKIGALISGTITCSSDAEFGELNVWLTQSVGRITVHGFGFDSPTCGPEPTSWTTLVPADNGRFSGGFATANVSAFACNAFSCGDTFAAVVVRLRR